MATKRPITDHADVALVVSGLFHSAAGYFAYRPRGTGDWLLIYTLGGRGRFGFGRDGAAGELLTQVGDLVLLRPGTPHDYGVEPELQQWDLLWAHFNPRPHWVEWLAWPEVASGLHKLHLPTGAGRERIQAKFVEAHEIASGARRLRDERAMHALEAVLLECDASNPLAAGAGKLDPRVRDAMDFACRNLRQKLTLDDLADAAAMSVSRFSHLFRQQVRTTPQQFVERQRLTRAQQLLELSALSVK
ncbi:MAG TPA: AraC family ligand binding domain-containing protein, partial [Tepidisphaeraceae bacterium]|nr:AraC family ligand binding domain-containing protein [Tepidisphaeraceae bacterium]